MLGVLLFFLSLPARSAELPWSGCAERAVEVVRASVPAGGRVVVSPFVDMGGRLDYFGEALAGAVSDSLGHGATAFVLLEPSASSADARLSGSVIDAEKEVDAVAALAVGAASPVEAVRCRWDKDAAFAQAMREELLRRRGLLEDDRGRLDSRISAIDELLAKGVWKEGPSFAVPVATPTSVTAAAAPAAVPGRRSWWGAGYLEKHRTRQGFAAAARMRAASGLWDGMVDFGHYSRRDEQHTWNNLAYGLVSDRRILEVYYLRFSLLRRLHLPVEYLPAGMRMVLPDTVTGGGGLGLHLVRERLLGRDNPSGSPFIVPAPDPDGSQSAIWVKPHIIGGVSKSIGHDVELEAAADYTFFSHGAGPFSLQWGGLGVRVGAGVRFH